jgi:hypothetical protein
MISQLKVMIKELSSNQDFIFYFIRTAAFKLQRKQLNVIKLGLTKRDNINQKIEIFLLIQLI